jgi:hypothetical protein
MVGVGVRVGVDVSVGVGDGVAVQAAAVAVSAVAVMVACCSGEGPQADSSRARKTSSRIRGFIFLNPLSMVDFLWRSEMKQISKIYYGIGLFLQNQISHSIGFHVLLTLIILVINFAI